MSFLESLRRAPQSPQAQWNVFIIEYRPGAASIFLFHEGRDDPSFYRGFVEQVKPDGYVVRFVCCGTKKAVLERAEDFRSRHGDDPRVLFFVDKDHDDLIGEVPASGYSYLFTTRAYSIENYVCNGYVLRRYLVEVVGMPDMDSRVSAILERYESHRNALYTVGLPIMAWMIAARIRFGTVNLNNIDSARVFALGDELEPQLQGSEEDVLDYLARVTGSDARHPRIPTEDLSEPIVKLQELEPQTWFRGKQELWYLVKFLDGIVRMLRDGGNGPKCRVSLSTSNALEVLGPRAPWPPCLREFLNGAMSDLRQGEPPGSPASRAHERQTHRRHSESSE